MVRNYVRKTNRQSWDEVKMQQAVFSVTNGDQGYRNAAQMYGVPQTTLERRVAKYKKDNDIEFACTKGFGGGFRTVFSQAEEDELAQYVQQMERMLFGLTPDELCGLAFELAERNNIAHPFKKENQAAGYDWYRGFMARHPFLSLRKPEATLAARAQGFNKVAVKQFFDHLEEVYDNNDLTPDRVYNCDETGMTTVPKTMSKIIATRGKSQVGGLTSAERGQLVTTVICCSAAGSFMPPMLIFPRVRMKDELMDGAPPGSTFECHPSGWIQTHLFISWMTKFVKFSGATKDRKVLDGHATHTKSLDLIDLARDNGVIMLCLPPHCTHRLQPLDITFMKPLSVYYEQEVKKWLRQHPRRVVTQFQIAQLFGTAYLRSATMLTATNGFKTPGIFPMDRHVFSDADFLSADATDLEQSHFLSSGTVAGPSWQTSPPPIAACASTLPTDGDGIALFQSTFASAIIDAPPPAAASTLPISGSSATSPPSANASAIITPAPPPPAAASTLPIAGSSATSPPSANASAIITPAPPPPPAAASASPITGPIFDLPATPDRQVVGFLQVSPHMVIPYPKQDALVTKRSSRKRGKTAILTSSPYKKALQEDHAKKNPSKPTLSGKSAAVGKSAPKMKGTGKGKQRREYEDVNCLYCEGKWSESSESWVHCGECELWAHYSCAGIDEDDRDPHFLCELCSQADN